jgi:hypothetical protein
VNVVRALPAALISLARGLFQLGQPSLCIDEAFNASATGWTYEQLSDTDHWLYSTLIKQ